MERRASTVLVASQHNLTPAPHPNPNQAPHGAARERAHEWMMAPHGWSGADLCVSPLTSARFVGMNGEEAVGVGGGDARLTPVPHAPVFETKWFGLGQLALQRRAHISARLAERIQCCAACCLYADSVLTRATRARLCDQTAGSRPHVP